MAFEADNTKRSFSATPLVSAGLFALSMDELPRECSVSLYPGTEVREHFAVRNDSADWNGKSLMRVVSQAITRFLPVRAG